MVLTVVTLLNFICYPELKRKTVIGNEKLFLVRLATNQPPDEVQDMEVSWEVRASFEVNYSRFYVRSEKINERVELNNPAQQSF